MRTAAVKVLARAEQTLAQDHANLTSAGCAVGALIALGKADRAKAFIERRTFSLEDVYAFEEELRAAYPGNRHVRAKIRQKLQVLRDKGFLEFVGRGQYRLVRNRR
jgi:hypothetical protein